MTIVAFLAISGAGFAVAWVFGLAMRLRLMGLGVFFGLCLGASFTAQVAGQTGGDPPAAWLTLGAIMGLGLVYALGVRRLKARAGGKLAVTTPTEPPAFSSTELQRYARQITLRDVGGMGQKRLKSAHVLVIGAGGLGAPVLQYLAASGVGTISVIDPDTVENSNLARQIIHTDAAIGMAKVASARRQMLAQNPFITVHAVQDHFTPDNADHYIAGVDLVLDGCDDFATRVAVNAACVRHGVPLISGALAQWEGQVALFDVAHGTPCYACVFPNAPDRALAPTCAEAGVVSALPGVIGTMMAMEAIKHLTGAGDTLAGKMHIYDGLYLGHRTMTLKPAPLCPICSGARTPKETT